MPTEKEDVLVRALLTTEGRTFAQAAGIRLADTPGPLYQLLVLATLASARISADVAVTAARELFAAGCRSPRAMRRATWQDLVDALDRGRYARYDGRTATMLADGADLLLRRWHGDLRLLRDEAGGAPRRIVGLLMHFPGIGPVGADIFLREVQDIWPSVAPYADARVTDGARKAGLPTEPAALAALAGPGNLARIASALVRVSRSERVAARVLAATD
ncbi:MAG: endonuclease [Streptosporangiaceae bacterium]